MPNLGLDAYLTFEYQQFSYRNCVMCLSYIALLFIISINTLAHFSALWQDYGNTWKKLGLSPIITFKIVNCNLISKIVRNCCSTEKFLDE